ncbi:MAG: hypothetical protein CO126_10385 [Hydrogenophilales bacterium CG_4_9_14_3_um_filter_63_34]|nr:MAG: hypothetical protein COZ24_07780 [Hydrogenophilales bacterium CG_4_10_14_3_um_filter_63_21]PJB02747.1 MAG: hypothetical protein CO126_10385 [Hydrogenophilales bacterium CG_4_9_14_3_um_filter_63_34]
MRRWLLAGVGICLAGAVCAALGRLLRDEPLRGAPTTRAPERAQLARGEAVDIQERQGGWTRVISPQGDGWVRMLSLRGDPRQAVLSELKGELGLDARRIETRIVAVAGFRGGEEEDQAEAAGRAALQVLDAYRVDGVPTVVPTRLGPACEGAPPRATAASGTLSGSHLSLISAWALNRLEREHEACIGRALAGRLLNLLPAANEPEAQRFLNQVGRRLLATQGVPDAEPWLFALLDSEEIHAFATPGGHNFLTRGLYRLLRDEAELAAVLAREIARLDAQLLLHALRQQATSGGRPRDETAFLRQLLGNGLDRLIRPYPEESEYQADRVGVLLAARAGYDPYALIAFLQTLSGLAENDPRGVLMSRTHPRAESQFQ